MCRAGVSFYQILPGISDASLPSDHNIYILSFSQFSCTTSCQVQLDLVLDAIQQRWVEAVVAQVHRLHARSGPCRVELVSDDLDVDRLQAAVREIS
jgi:hypothetical protein